MTTDKRSEPVIDDFFIVTTGGSDEGVSGANIALISGAAA
jgi:hypothetical protein